MDTLKMPISSSMHLPAYADASSGPSSVPSLISELSTASTSTTFSLQEALDEIELLSAAPPAYSCSVQYSGTVLRKLENTLDETSDKLHVPFRRAWQVVHIILRGTILEVYKAKTTGGLVLPGPLSGAASAEYVTRTPGQPRRSDSMPAFTAETHPLRLRSGSAPTVTYPAAADSTMPEMDLSSLQRTHTYSLRGAVVGIAADYRKKSNVLRLRIGRDQLLLHCPLGALSCVHLLDAIQKAVGIAEPLESRKEPLNIWAPRRMKMRSTLQQAYELFEAAQPDGPLKQRTFAGRTRIRGGDQETRAAMREVVAPSALLSRSSAARPAGPGRAVSSMSVASTRSHKAISGTQAAATAAATASSSRRPGMSAQSSSRSFKAKRPERYVCAVLQASFPRQLPRLVQ